MNLYYCINSKNFNNLILCCDLCGHIDEDDDDIAISSDESFCPICLRHEKPPVEHSLSKFELVDLKFAPNKHIRHAASNFMVNPDKYVKGLDSASLLKICFHTPKEFYMGNTFENYKARLSKIRLSAQKEIENRFLGYNLERNCFNQIKDSHVN